ncbi:MAG TPA: BamA/TamA family outer membrane protein, partial [Bacteroidales bacterium]|nr:BamA/TamA family outer membrane protein [Bacteroidales bacterium]
FGLFFETSEIEDTPNRFITDFDNNGLNADVLKTKSHLGINGAFSFDTRNDRLFPTAGVYWTLQGGWYVGANKNSQTFNKISSDLSLYLSRKVNPRSVLALRFGGKMNNGDYDFINAANLGGKSNLRGYPATRFYGDAAAYQNTDLRIKLADIHSFYLSGQIGIFGFHDIGRVWVDEESSSIWHNGYGGGIWFSPFGMALISAQYEMSEEYDIFRVKFDFQF